MLAKYSLFSLFSLGFNKLLTMLFYNKSRLIRRPFYIRGKKNINLGKGLTTGVGCRLDALPIINKTVISIGKNVQLNDYVHIGAIDSITIGNNVLIASKVFITDHNHGDYSKDNQENPNIFPSKRTLYSKAVSIQDNVWIGETVSILPGVTIGKGSIIGTMSVVTKDIPPYCIAVGSPAKVIKEYSFLSNRWEGV